MRKTLLIITTIAVLGMMSLYLVPVKKPNTNSVASTVLAASQPPIESEDDTPLGVNTATPTPTPQNTSTSPAATLKDGTFTGNNSANPYGNVQIAIIVSSGKITSVNVISMPNRDSHSSAISNYAKPILVNSTLNRQSASIDTVSGATYTSNSYIQSLQSAIDKSKV
jgi:uncharacterized protein with FMN-binding domain